MVNKFSGKEKELMQYVDIAGYVVGRLWKGQEGYWLVLDARLRGHDDLSVILGSSPRIQDSITAA